MRPPDLNHLEALDPVRPTALPLLSLRLIVPLVQDAVGPRAVGQPKAYPEPVFKSLKAYQLPRPIERFVRSLALFDADGSLTCSSYATAPSDAKTCGSCP